LKGRLGQYAASVLFVLALVILAYYMNSNGGNDATPTPLAGGSERDNRLIGEIDLARLYPEHVLRQKQGGEKLVALSFDDGPDNVYTPQILDVLKEKNVKATFFLIGNRVDKDKDVVKRIVAEGHDVGNHTFTHPELLKTTGDLQTELAKTEEALKPFGITTKGLFRPPYGAINPSLVLQAAQLGYKTAMWSVDSLDWHGLSEEEVFKNIENHVTPGAIILQHSAGGPGEDLSGTVLALPKVIDSLRDKGYKFVKIREMFSLSP
jgi:peptidoglycan/xylan/chitin deacetylase (PgdA/CDA1 family)